MAQHDKENFDRILAPFAQDKFRQSYWGQNYLHIPAENPDKFADVMGWEKLTALLNQTPLWNPHNLQLVDHGKMVPAEGYCRPESALQGQKILRPQPDLLKNWLQKGASLVLNDIDNLTPQLKALATVLETNLQARAQGNLYCSWQSHQGFGSHFDTHDVFAFHVAGTKTWRLYQRHFTDPIAHPAFKTLGQAFHEKHKGALAAEITLKPGDLLYIPRGWYHDAIAQEGGTIHIAFGLTYPIGVDLISALFERAVLDPLWRARLSQDQDVQREQLAKLADTIAGYVKEPAFQKQISAFVENFRYPRSDISLPEDAAPTPSSSPLTNQKFAHAQSGVKLMDHQGQKVITDGKKALPIPPENVAALEWIFARASFDAQEWEMAPFTLTPAARKKLLQDLLAMKILRVYS